MYYYISGELILTDASFVVVDAGGIGYKLTVSGNTLGKLAGKAGSKVCLYTYLAVKEDAMELYGFSTQDELSAFKLLISVSGVGAKSAVSILSLMSPEKLTAVIANGDSKAISRAQGIGAKTAARIVLELKDKIKKEISLGLNEVETQGFQDEDSNSNYSEAIKALIVLGYTKSEAVYALKNCDFSLSIEELIKQALSKLIK